MVTTATTASPPAAILDENDTQNEVVMPRSGAEPYATFKVDSSNVAEIGYEEGNWMVSVIFKAKPGVKPPEYRYFNVSPETWQAFKESPSKGTFVHSVLKAGVKSGAYRCVGPI